MSEQNLKRMILALAGVINLLVAINTVLHNPFVGYDAKDHLDYMSVVAVHLPTTAGTGEYYSPPLPYYLPSLFFQSCTSGELFCKYAAGKFAQALNLILSVIITIFLIKTAERIKPGNPYFKLATLLIFGLFTVYYKTFSQVRGEPYVALFTILSIYLLLKLSRMPETVKLKDALILGLCLGGLGLSRQWGFLLFPAIACFALFVYSANRTSGSKYGAAILFSFFIAFLCCSWFYFHLRNTFGSFTAFNVGARSFSFSNQPLSFYKNTGLGNLLLFRSPTRNTFDKQFMPLFYSDTWGDYWCYFTCVRNLEELGYRSNGRWIDSYLGRVNFAALLPSLLLAAGLVFGFRSLLQTLQPALQSFESRCLAFLFLVVFISLAGYLWFLIKYPLLPRGTTIKATYMIQIFMALPFLAASFMEHMRATWPWIYRTCMVLLLVVFAHNLPAMITHYR